METIEVRFINIFIGLHGRFVYTRPAPENRARYDQYFAEAIGTRFPFGGTLVGRYGLMERSLSLSEVAAKRREGYVIVAAGENLLPLWYSIIDSADRLNEAGIDYRVRPNNSNAFTNTALWRAGLPKVEPFREIGEIFIDPGLDVLLDLRPLRKGEVDEKPEDRQLRIPDTRNTILGESFETS